MVIQYGIKARNSDHIKKVTKPGTVTVCLCCQAFTLSNFDRKNGGERPGTIYRMGDMNVYVGKQRRREGPLEGRIHFAHAFFVL